MSEPWLDPLPLSGVRDVLRERRPELLVRRRRLVVLGDPAAHPDHLAERPVRDAVTVGEASAAVPEDVVDEAVDVLLELPREARLADARDPDDGEEVRLSLLRGRVEEVLDHPQLALPPDERRLEAFALQGAAAARRHPQRPEEPDRLGLSLQLVHPGVAVGDRRLGRSLRRFADEHRTGLGGRLYPRRAVHEVTGDHPLADRAERDGGASGQDAGSGPYPRPADPQ